MPGSRGHSKLFVRLFSMFLVVALVPTIVLGAFSTISSNRRMVEQLRADSGRLLEWIKSNTDRLFLNLELDSVELALDPDLRAILSRTLTRSQRILRLKDLQETLRAKFHAGRGDHLVYFRDPDRVLTATGFYESDYLEELGMDTAILLNGSGFPRVIQDGAPKFRMVRPIPLDSAVPLGGLSLTVSLADIENLLSTWAAQSGFELAVVDGDGRVLLCSLPWDSTSGRIPLPGGDVTLGGIKYRVRTLASDYRGWSYASLVARNVVVESAFDVASATIAISLALVLGGAILSFLLSRFIYNPIAGLYNLTRTRFAISSTGIEAEDELRFLDRAIRNLISSSDSLSRLVEKSSYALKGEYFASVMAGGLTGASVEEMNERAVALGIALPYDAFVLVAIELDRGEGSRVTDGFPVRRLIVARTAERAELGANLHNETFYLDAERIGIVVSGDEAADLQESSVEMARRLARTVEDQNGFTVSAGVGTTVSRLSHLSESRLAAERALERKMHVGKNSVIVADPVLQTDESVFVIPLIEMERISNRLKAGDLDAATGGLREMFRQLREHRDMPIENVRYVLIQLVSVISQGLMESGVNLRAIFGPEFNLFRELERRKTLGDIETWMVEMLKQIGARQQSPSPERTELISHALTRIRSRYAEQISLSTIADELGVSPEHLSRRFKAETGERYVELVNRLRLEKARELVVNTDWTLDVVAKESGFSNYQYLIRRYKHRFGVTPARHRETRSAKKNTDDTIS